MSFKAACIFLRGGKHTPRELSDDEIDELRDAFNEFDKDKDGLINCKDLGNLMRTMGYMPTEMELIELSQKINMSLGGSVDFEDFVELMTPKLYCVIELHSSLVIEYHCLVASSQSHSLFHASQKKDYPLTAPFSSLLVKFDMDGDGKITTEELRLTMIKLMGDHMTPREIDSIVKEADDNGDGTVDFEEFVGMMSR
ncbi:calcium-binding protein 5a [Cynoglossus semilaevis]|uniref:calcium-binding protein 5a n=1 Tax=Cynoglossus semilaevis TaxID=244447 RepID=UPI000D62CD2E|nr:calcium-binding protein 5-like [Cynoglossus semilaevis]